MNVPVTIDVYPNDNLDSVKMRIAAKIKNVPRYILYPTFDLAKAKEDGTLTIEVVDLIRMFIDQKNYPRFIDIVSQKEINELIAQNDLDKVKDVARLFIYFRVRVNSQSPIPENDFSTYKDEVLVAFKLPADTKIFESIFFSEFVKSRKEFLSNLKSEIKRNRIQNEKNLDTFTSEEKIECVPYLPYEPENFNFTFETDLTNVPIEAVFDRIVLNKDCPFARYKNYYKIMKDFDLKTLPYFTNMKMAEQKLKDTELDLTKYNMIQIFLFQEKLYLKIENGSLIIRLEVQQRSSKLTNEAVINACKKLLPSLQFEVVFEREHSTIGDYLIPKQKLDPEIFSYLVMNNPHFSKYMYIDESSLATKMVEGIHCFYKTRTTNEKVKLVVTPRIVQQYDSTTRGKDPDLFPKGSSYITIRVKTNNLSAVLDFQKFFCRALSIYNTESPKIIEFYKKFIPDFPKAGKELKKLVVKEKPVTKILKDIFIKVYNRTCSKKKQVRLIDYEEAQTLLPLKKAIRFPDNDEEGRYYACRDKNLFPNFQTISGSKYPVVPCCKETPLEELGMLSLKESRDCLDLPDIKAKQTAILTTKASVSYNNVGMLKPFEDIAYIFSLNAKPGHHFLRLGMDRTKYSFLQCVLEAIRLVRYPNGGKTCKNRLEELKSEIVRISNTQTKVKHINTGKQSFRTESIEEISVQMRNETDYFSPQKYLDILESVYDCKIFVFTQDNIIIPEHVQNYILNGNLRRKKTVFILEHLGTPGENLLYPQCELIIQSSIFDLTKPVQKTFLMEEDPIVPIVFNLFDNIRLSYSVSKNAIYYDFEDVLLRNVSGQFFNGYGKTSGVLLDFSKDEKLKEVPELFLYTERPMPPLAVEQVKHYDGKVTFNQIKDFIALFPEVKLLLNSNGQLKMVKVTSDLNNTYFIPLEPSSDDALISLPKQVTTFSLPRGRSDFMKFNFNKRVAAYLGEYAKFLLSKWAKDRNLQYISDKDIIEFVKSKIKLDTAYKYTDLPSQFGVDNEGFVQDAKIIVNSEELLTRLVYYLRLEKDRIASYAELKIIPVTFDDILDFQVYDNQILLQNAKLVIDFISNTLSMLQLSNKVLTKLEEKPYIFQNDLVDRNPYLAINVDDENQALSIMSSWKNQQVISKTMEPVEEFDPMFYAFINERNINFISGTDTQFRILNYTRDDDEQKLVVLLRI